MISSASHDQCTYVQYSTTCEEYRNAFRRHTYLFEVFFIDYEWITTMNKKQGLKKQERGFKKRVPGCRLMTVGSARMLFLDSYSNLINTLRGEIPNIRIMYNDIEHSISIDFYIYISIFQVF
jgi:hypothetical protein